MKLLFGVLAAFSVFGQSFEVASVKPNHSGDGRIGINRPDDIRFSTTNTPLRILITFAYDIRDTQLSGGPGWINSERWDVIAKMETPVPKTQEGAEQIRKMLQALLEERFHLKIHRESKEIPVSVLTVAKTGARLKESATNAPTQMHGGLGLLEGTKISLPMLARALSSQTGRTFTDGTELKGEYDVKLEFAPEAGNPIARLGGPEHAETQAESDRPALGDALRDQLGLRMETGKEAVEMVVVDSAEKPEEN